MLYPRAILVIGSVYKGAAEGSKNDGNGAAGADAAAGVGGSRSSARSRIEDRPDWAAITPAGRTDLVLFDSTSIGLAAKQVATLVVSPAPGAARVAVVVLPQGLPAYVLVNTVVTSQELP